MANLTVTPWSVRDAKVPEVRLQDKKDGDEVAIDEKLDRARVAYSNPGFGAPAFDGARQACL